MSGIVYIRPIAGSCIENQGGAHKMRGTGGHMVHVAICIFTFGVNTSSRIMVAPMNIPLHRTTDSKFL